MDEAAELRLPCRAGEDRKGERRDYPGLLYRTCGAGGIATM
jgi:hypothetical protein